MLAGYHRLFQRAVAAVVAIFERCFGVSAAALAWPPILERTAAACLICSEGATGALR